MIKRTELEILDKAVQFAKDLQATQDQLKLLQDNGISYCVQEERKYKNSDLEGIRKSYEIKMANLRSELQAEIDKRVKETELANVVIALNDNIDLLRWLYKDTKE